MNMARDEFAQAVAAAISSVQHLYREVDRLMEGLRASLDEGTPRLILMRGTLGKSGRDQSRLIIRHEYGALFRAAEIGEDVEADDEDEDVDVEAEREDDDEDGGRERRVSGSEHIAAGQPLLAVRLVMFDPRRQEAFEPAIQYAVMTDWTLGKSAWVPDRQFSIQRYMLRRVPRALANAANLGAGARLQTRAAVKRVAAERRAADRRLACRLAAGTESVPLYQLDDARELERLASSIRSMWNGVANVS